MEIEIPGSEFRSRGLSFNFKRRFRGVIAKVMNKEIVVCEFELKSSYYVQFQTNTIRKGMNSLMPLAMG